MNADDVGFLNRLLDELLATYPIDPQRVYIYGYSAGAAMAHRMACDNAERFAGIVAGAGLTLGDPQLCAPSVPISVLQFHSKGDEVVLFEGGNFGSLGACPRKKSLKNNAFKLRRDDFKISHFSETRVLTGGQNFCTFLKNL